MRGFVMQRRALLHHFPVGPDIDVSQAKHDRQKQQYGQRQGASCRFQHTPNDEAPCAASQVLQHQQRQAAHCNSCPENESDKIRVKELAGINEQPDKQQR